MKVIKDSNQVKYLIVLLSMFFVTPVITQLTGEWKDDNGTCYRIRQIDNRIYWTMDARPEVINVFMGYLAGNTITGIWADVPGGDKMGNGTVSFRVESNNRLVKIDETGNYGTNSLVREVCAKSGGDAPSHISASPGKNSFLNKNEYIVSPSGKFFLHMQEDGNLVLYRGSGPNDRHEVIWHSGSFTDNVIDSFMAIQDDGNLVVYRGSPGDYTTPAWQSKTFGNQGSYFLAVTDNGKIIVGKGTGPQNNQGTILTRP